jgi:radical SAM protein with 4Fe4S-binding SPASM domain
MVALRTRAVSHLYYGGLRLESRGLPGATMLFRAALLLDPTFGRARRQLEVRAPRPADWPQRVRYVILGTTGTCNASCIHCPTGKPETAHNPGIPMPMELFRKIVDGIADHRLRVDGQIAFGLFGDALVDPYVVERAKYVRERLPEVSLSVNTNGAAFNRAKHAALRDLATVVSLHCESLIPAVYDDLMRPLRAARVFPKYQEMLDAFPNMLDVSIPITRKNIGEAAQIRDYFKSRGAHFVHFDPMMSRCAEDRSVFDALSLAPQRVRCGGDVGDDLIVDCDGTVLACCQDFQRLEPIGNLTEESFAETLANMRRATLRRQMVEGRHDERTTCARCFADNRTPDFPFDQMVA